MDPRLSKKGIKLKCSIAEMQARMMHFYFNQLHLIIFTMLVL